MKTSFVVWEDTRARATNSEDLVSNTTVNTQEQENEKITPVTGWVFGNNGEVTLVSNASKGNPEKLGSSKSCSAH